MTQHTLLRRLLIGLLILLGSIIYIFWGNTSIVVTEISVTADNLPDEFSGFRIAQISDLHNAEFGPGNKQLLQVLADSRPDIIVLTGDFIDSRRTNVSVSAYLSEQAVQIAPTYYVTGNHEHRIPEEYEELKTSMTAAGVHILENELVSLERNGAAVSLLGIHDWTFTPVYESLATLTPQASDFTILLAHRPEWIRHYAAADIDLVFSGHVHGGQVRLPLLGGLFGPGQGFLPRYDGGLYAFEGTQMVVSRGLGNSLFPFRVNNRPELVVAELHPS